MKRVRVDQDQDEEKLKHAVYAHANGVPFLNSKTIHMELSKGDLASRIITVGSEARLQKIELNLDKAFPIKVYKSGRGFHTVTGKYNGVDVSIVSIGMGLAMMDFFVREALAITESDSVAIVRFGTCGGIHADSRPGRIAVATNGCGLITRNYSAFYPTESESDSVNSQKYILHNIVPSNNILSSLVVSELKETLDDNSKDHVLEGSNVSADGFYASQGRYDPNFNDDNHDVFKQIHTKYPDAMTMEMETYQLFHLAKCSKIPVHATSAVIILANRFTEETTDFETLESLEQRGGIAILKAITKMDLK